MIDTAVPVQAIDALLPQTQCTKCGYDGCRPYAQAIAHGEADINRCPPGGQEGVLALARLLDIAPLPLDLERGAPGPLLLAVIDEAHCIGCTLCIQACPVDAIVGANKHMHTVLADWCTGCDLCVAPCPVDCISMQPALHEWTPPLAAQARVRHDDRQVRLTRLRRESDDRLATHHLLDAPEPACSPGEANEAAAPGPTQSAAAAGPSPTPAAADSDANKHAAIAQALAMARARRRAKAS